MTNPLRGSFALLACAMLAISPVAARVAAASLSSPGFNLFSEEQDIEIGRQSAAEAEKKLRLLNDASVDAYLGRIVRNLAAQTPGGKYPYTIKAVDDAAINAFSLPGGPMYANRGLIEAARNEAELAGVLAHEMAHVALRHGTEQASNAYLVNAGLGVLGGLLGDSGGQTSQMVSAVGGLGLNAVFLKFSRDDEYEADRLGAQIMASAGYDPSAMADFFGLLRAEGARNPGALETFFSDHPPSAEREARIRAQAKTLARNPPHAVGGFDTVVAELKQRPSSGSQPLPRLQPSRSVDVASAPPAAVQVAAPAAQFETFEHAQGYFSIKHPANWQAYGSKSGYATSLAPAGGVVETAKGQQALVYGVVVNHYAPFDAARRGKRASLKSATDDLVAQILRSNPYLRAKGAPKSEKIDGVPALSVTLAGRSPVTGEDERVVVVTRRLPDRHVIYGLLVTPERDYGASGPIFARMMRSLDVHDRAKHG